MLDYLKKTVIWIKNQKETINDFITIENAIADLRNPAGFLRTSYAIVKIIYSIASIAHRYLYAPQVV